MNRLRGLNSILLKGKDCMFYTKCNKSDLYTPDYLQYMLPKVPLYNTLNIQIRGYDYPILENFQKFIHNIAKNMDIDVEDAWATPPQDMKISTFKPRSEIVNSIYNLKTFERIVQVTDISTLQLPVLLRVLEASCPAGVDLSVVPHEEYHDQVRYIPDKELLDLKQELDVMGGPRKVK